MSPDADVRTVVLEATEAMLEVLRENRFLWFLVALMNLGYILTDDTWWRLLYAALFAFAVYRVVQAWRLIRDGVVIVRGLKEP